MIIETDLDAASFSWVSRGPPLDNGVEESNERNFIEGKEGTGEWARWGGIVGTVGLVSVVFILAVIICFLCCCVEFSCDKFGKAYVLVDVSFFNLKRS